MRRAGAGRRPSFAVLAVAAVLLTLAVRLPVLLASGGLLSAVTVDDGVHFAGAASLLAGRWPYRDFLFLHPPGVLLALLPFAALARVVGDATAFAAARAAFIGLGAVGTGLAVLALRPFGRSASAVGATACACSFPIVFAERSALLEPLLAIGLLGALALLAAPPTRSRTAGAGVLLGLLAVVKLPFALPALVVLLAAGRRAPGAALAALVAGAATCLPFAVVAGPAMVQQIVVDQAGRRRIVPDLAERLAQILPAPTVLGAGGTPVMLSVAVVLLLIGVVTPGARRYAVMLLLDTAVLLVGPSFYGHYAILSALPAALLAGVAAGRLARAPIPLGLRSAGVLVVAAAVVLGTLGAWSPERLGLLTTPRLPASLAAAVQRVRGCTAGDRTTSLILADRLTPQLEERCPIWPDVTGWQFAGGGRTAAGAPRWPDQDPVYQRRVRRYLCSGRAVLLTAPKDGLAAITRAAVTDGPVRWSGPEGSLHLVARPGC